MPPTNKVQVNMKHRLPGRCVTIHDHAVTFPGKALICCDLPGCQEQATDNGLVARRKIVDRCNMFTWNDNDMRRRLWVDIAKRDCLIGFVNNVRRNITGKNFAEQAVQFSHKVP